MDEPKKLLSFGPYRYYDFREYVEHGRWIEIPCPLSETGLIGTITVDEDGTVTVNVDCTSEAVQ